MHGVTDARLRRQVNDLIEALRTEQFRHRVPVGDVEMQERKARPAAKIDEARFLQFRIVIAVEVIDADDLVAALEKTQRCIKADKAGRTSYQKLHCGSPRCEFLAEPKTTLGLDAPPVLSIKSITPASGRLPAGESEAAIKKTASGRIPQGRRSRQP